MFSSDLAVAKEQFIREVEKLHSQQVKPGLGVRKREVDKLIEEYVAATGTRPDAHALRRLGDYLLVDLLTDQQKHHREDEYPFHTNKQSKRRKLSESEGREVL